MRNPERIDVVLGLVTKIWKKQPDTRFNQLINNLQSEFNYMEKRGAYLKEVYNKITYKGNTLYEKNVKIDLFNVEDEDFIVFLEKKVAKDNGQD